MESADEKVVSAIVIDWCFIKHSRDDDLKLSLDLQMFDGTLRSIDFDWEGIVLLFDLFSQHNHYFSGWNMNLVHERIECLVEPNFKETPLGLMKTAYKIKAIRNNIHQDWVNI
ncbi:MAG: hypothetical protein IJH63_10250 [Methanobrevibacter sp.]|nr:hypothetical protein [Methanosphaera sp.]MBR0371080.1 hypothetical protein [Methanobrevibacter sp.]